MASLARAIRIGMQFQRASWRSAMQYRFNAILMLVTGIIYQGSGFAFVWVVFHQFPTLAGWTFADIAFLYGLRLVSHAAYLVPFNALTSMDILLREGDFDRYLLRPLNPLVQMMTTRGMRVGAIGDLTAGLAILVTASQAVHLSWTPVTVCLVLLAITGGALIEAAIQLALASWTFRLLSTFELRLFADGIVGRFGSYPLAIFGAGLEWVLTFLLPVAFIAYIPASAVLGMQTRWFPSWIAYLTPVLGGFLLWLAYRLWIGQLRYYQSTGH